jgi:Insulinase (Peptidase family M16)
MVDETRNIRRTVLPNGLTVITEQMTHLRSVSIGIWVKTGSRHEDSDLNGISHFVATGPHKTSPARLTLSAATWMRSLPRSVSASI